MDRKLVGFFFEIGQLKRVKRSGWWCAGVKEPESVAEHCFRAALIGYFMAERQRIDSGKVVLMLLMHDLPESRMCDFHKVAQRYIDTLGAEEKIISEQAAEMGGEGKKYSELMQEFLECKSREALLARDADLLECAIQAKEYMECGYRDAENWIDNIGKKLGTKAAKEALKKVKESRLRDWWENLKKI